MTSQPPPSLMDELSQQPEALLQLLRCLQESQDILAVEHNRGKAPWVFTGMGASFHAAWIGALHLNHLGVPAIAIEASDILQYTPHMLDWNTRLVYISQSGTSGEVIPLLERLKPNNRLVAITNNPRSDLAQHAATVLSMCASEEHWVASKTYANTLAILWLLARQAAGIFRPADYQTLSRLAVRMSQVLSQAAQIQQTMLAQLDVSQPLLFTGHGPHAATSRQAAMLLSEWAKVPALNNRIGAFRHGFIEAVRPGYGVVIFSAPGPSYESARLLAAELVEYGGRVLRIENGSLCAWDQPQEGIEAVDEFLSPVLDILPVQLYAEGLARRLGIQPGFRYIGKVVTKL
jgi:glucosamine--fructose-6-phosphate aminotransferase (isomerizing)